MMLQAIKVEEKESRYGGKFYYLFFKDPNAAQGTRSFRTCIYPQYGNFRRWQPVVEAVKRGEEVLLINLCKRGRLVDADSQFTRIQPKPAAEPLELAHSTV